MSTPLHAALAQKENVERKDFARGDTMEIRDGCAYRIATSEIREQDREVTPKGRLDDVDT